MSSEENTACNSGHCSSSDEKPQTRKSFDFPDGGWECSKCQNYNFKGRKECFRCKKSKDQEDHEGKPEHMNKLEKLAHSKKGKKNARPKNYKKKQFAQDINDENSNFMANKQFSAERAGDWVCQSCFNHNFSFREVCNKCQCTQSESNQMILAQ